MRKFCFISMIAAFLLFFTIRIQAQTTQTKPDQVKLMKQFIGYWKCEVSKDTTIFFDTKPYGTGYDNNFMYVTKGKTIVEGKEFGGYDKMIDKYIYVEVTKGSDL